MLMSILDDSHILYAMHLGIILMIGPRLLSSDTLNCSSLSDTASLQLSLCHPSLCLLTLCVRSVFLSLSKYALTLSLSLYLSLSLTLRVLLSV